MNPEKPKIELLNIDMSQSLLFIDYLRREIKKRIESEISFFCPIVSKELTIYRASINHHLMVKVFNGESCSVCNDEDILERILSELIKSEKLPQLKQTA